MAGPPEPGPPEGLQPLSWPCPWPVISCVRVKLREERLKGLSSWRHRGCQRDRARRAFTQRPRPGRPGSLPCRNLFDLLKRPGHSQVRDSAGGKEKTRAVRTPTLPLQPPSSPHLPGDSLAKSPDACNPAQPLPGAFSPSPSELPMVPPKHGGERFASFLPLKPPETGPPAVPGTGEGQSGEGQASPLAHLPASIFDGMVVVLGRIVAGWVQVSVEGKGRL